MRRVVRLPGIEPIRLDRGDHVARLERHDHVVISLGLGDLDVAQGAFHHCGRAREAVFLNELALQAAGIDADAHRDAPVLGLADDLAIAVVAADITRVDANLVDGMIEGGQRHLIIKMDVADERQVNALFDLAEHGGVLRLGHGDADDLAAGCFHALDFGDGGLDVVGIGRGHRLDPDRIVAADDLVADANLTGLMPLEHVLISHPVPRPTELTALCLSRGIAVTSRQSRLPEAVKVGTLVQLS